MFSFRNITFKRFSRIGPTAPPLSKAVPKARHLPRISLHRTLPVLSTIITSFILSTGGEIPLRMYVHRSLLRSRLSMAWPAVLPITWTSGTRSGLTKTTRRLEAREPVYKALSLPPVLGYRHAVLRPRERSLMSPTQQLSQRIRSNWSWAFMKNSRARSTNIFIM